MLLERAFSNVMSNCIRYAGTQVAVAVREKEGDILITVTDDGLGFQRAVRSICLTGSTRARAETMDWVWPLQGAPWSTWAAACVRQTHRRAQNLRSHCRRIAAALPQTRGQKCDTMEHIKEEAE